MTHSHKNFLFYTTSIIYKQIKLCYYGEVRKEGGRIGVARKESGVMFTIVQGYLHSEHKDPALYLKEEQSLNLCARMR